MAEEDNNGIIGYTSEETRDLLTVHIDVSDPETALVDVDEDEIRVLVPANADGDTDEPMLLGEIPLPHGVDTDSMEASLEDGHLDIIMRKNAEA